MSTIDLRERLQDLPPDLERVPDRFDGVRRRVRRRQRRRAAGLAVAAALAVVALPVASRVAAGGSDAHPDRRAPAATPSPAPSESPQPGADRVVELSDPLVREETGPAVVPLGPHPTGATAVSISLTCLSAGTFRYPDGASMRCGSADLSTSAYVVDLKPDEDELRIRAGRSASWRITTTYVRVTETSWAVNANGETYGVANDRGEPDLVAVAATEGRDGYVYAVDLDGPTPSSPADAIEQQEADEGKEISIPVYESDGETVVGEFTFGDAE